MKLIDNKTDLRGMDCLPRADFLRAYAWGGGVRAVTSSVARTADQIGNYFDRADRLLNDVFDG